MSEQNASLPTGLISLPTEDPDSELDSNYSSQCCDEISSDDDSSSDCDNILL